MGHLRSTLWREARCLLAERSDDGMPFDPLQNAAPVLTADIEARPVGGLGLHFGCHFADDVGYRHRHGRNDLRLTTRLTDQSNLE